jgi:hypothetical protein
VFAKPEHSIFTVLTRSIFPNGGQLYIFHKLNHADIFSRLCTCFLNNLIEFHSRNNEVLQTTRRLSQTEDLKLRDDALIETIQMDIWNA